MIGNCRAKSRALLFPGMVLAAWLSSPWAHADDGPLVQQLRIQQHASGFQLMLEQIQERARRRAVVARAAADADATIAAPRDLGDPGERLRLEGEAVTGPLPRDADEESAQRMRAQQDFERDQRRILDLRQDRSALVGARFAGPADLDVYATRRSELTRFNTQNQRLTLQRKLRR